MSQSVSQSVDPHVGAGVVVVIGTGVVTGPSGHTTSDTAQGRNVISWLTSVIAFTRLASPEIPAGNGNWHLLVSLHDLNLLSLIFSHIVEVTMLFSSELILFQILNGIFVM